MTSVSIITITYNSEGCIRDTIRSVLQQKYRPLQYVLIDGASTDCTIDIIKEEIPNLMSAGIDVKFVSEPDKGISDAFNKGIRYATGDIIGIINAGDCYSKDAVEVVMDNNWGDMDLLCGDVLWIDAANQLKYVRKSNISWGKLKYEMTVMHPSCFVKKTVYEECGMFDISYKYAMDYDFICRLYRSHKVLKYQGNVIASMSAGGVSDTDITKIRDEIRKVCIKNEVRPIIFQIHWFWLVFRKFLADQVKKRKLFFK